MRELTPGMFQYPAGEETSHRIFVLDEAQQITPQAQELLNKVLEEPPETTMIFLCTTNKKGLKRTLLGRCAKLNFRRVTKRQCGAIITQVFKDAEQEVPDQDATEDLFRRANGSVRDLLVLLDAYLRGTYNVGSDYAEEDIIAWIARAVNRPGRWEPSSAAGTRWKRCRCRGFREGRGVATRWWLMLFRRASVFPRR